MVEDEIGEHKCETEYPSVHASQESKGNEEQLVEEPEDFEQVSENDRSGPWCCSVWKLVTTERL